MEKLTPSWGELLCQQFSQKEMKNEKVLNNSKPHISLSHEKG